MTFSEYYAIYLTKHQNKWNRRLHVLGQIVTILFFLFVVKLVAVNSLFYLPLFAVVPLVVYPFAWSGHFFIEKNTPAAFKNPIWAKASDWVMLKDIIIGRVPF